MWGTFSPLPRWVVLPSGPQSDAEEGSFSMAAKPDFQTGAVLFALDQVLRADPPWRKALAMRQALAAAVAACKLVRLNADADILRDAEQLTRTGDDPGPAGRLHRRLRVLASEPLDQSPTCLDAISAELGGHEIITEVVSLLQADLAVAKFMRWPRPVLLHLTAVLQPAFRTGLNGVRPRIGDGLWHELQSSILKKACLSAYAEALRLQRQSRLLAEAVSRLRTKSREKGLALIMSDDCLAPWRMAGARGLGSDRAARRFCEALVARRALRRLTDRPAFRLYGM
jgi:Protein of unknown function (DUF1403)